MRIVPVLSALAVAACASSGSGGGSSSPAPIEQGAVSVAGPAGTTAVTVAGTDNSNVQTLPFTVDAVWRALPAIFDSLGIPVKTLDPMRRTIGNTGFTVRHRLKNRPLSRLIDCGQSQMGPSADDYDVLLAVMVDVRPAAGGSGATLTTNIDAKAKPPNYAQDYTACSSRGIIESSIADQVKLRLAK
ncbi:MAG TPA: hypothetical protein VHV78_01255 [Gemmatimonadaceae bacterium]|nr:hypothetical protein [Gemmatimonadaceae bacterium]